MNEESGCFEKVESLKPEIKLLSFTKNPLATIYNVWKASRTDESVDDFCDDHLNSKEMEEVIGILKMDMPLAEFFEMIFVCDHISVTWREHVVRHRVGSRIDDRIGVDIIPELGTSTFWSQAIRIKDMTQFYDNGHFRIPQNIEGTYYENKYREHIKRSQDLYKEMVEFGIEREDAREVFPLAMTHRLSWKLNFASLKKIIGKRSCWISQATLWHPIIVQMVNEICSKIHPELRFVVYPPCISKTECKFTQCVFDTENLRRWERKDKVPPCPLWLNYCRNERDYENILDDTSLSSVDAAIEKMHQHKLIHEQKVFNEKLVLFTKLWNHDPFKWGYDRTHKMYSNLYYNMIRAIEEDIVGEI